MTSTYWFYFLWAVIQHHSVIAACWFLPVDIIYNVLLSILLFTLCHYPNYPLMYVTCFGGVFVYFTFGVLMIREGWYALLVLPLFSLVHAAVGRYLINKGWEMRVLWLHPNWPFNKSTP